MDNEIISYREMCNREESSLQKGMNFFANRPYSVVLMSVRRGARYADRVEEAGRVLIYEGHDAPRNTVDGDPSTVDQPGRTPSGSLTENGRFLEAARATAKDGAPPRLVRVYEKLQKGIWSYNGEFLLADAWREQANGRQVFKFKLAIRENARADVVRDAEFEHNRMIPPDVKFEVFRRDGGKCVECGATDGLHFDHVLAYSRGGSSVTAANIQLLCARHNLQKGARIA